MACNEKKYELSKYLLENGYDVRMRDICGNSALHIACKDPSGSDFINFLIKKDQNLVKAKNIDGDLPLHIACLYGNRGVVRILLNISVEDINAQNEFDRTPLHIV